MKENILFEKHYQIKGGDFRNGGWVSTEVKSILKQLGLNFQLIRRVSIAAYEAEMNVVIYAKKADFSLIITPEKIKIIVDDEGPGIENLELAMKEGYSTAPPKIREMGFGAGMGLPNMKKNSDCFQIESHINRGTKVKMEFLLNKY